MHARHLAAGLIALASTCHGAAAPPAKAPPASTPPASTPPAGTPPVATPPAKPAAPATAANPSISGRPPEDGSPLRRYEPRLWEVKLEANVYMAPTYRGQVAPMQLQNVVAWVPIIVQSTWSQVDPGSLQGQLFVEGKPRGQIADRIQWRYQLVHGLAGVGMAVGDVLGQSLRWNMSWREQVWNTQLNDAAAAAIPWPQAWPQEVQAALQPQPGVESDAPDFQKFVERISAGKLRSVTPFVAAKQLIRATVGSFRTVDNSGLRSENGFTRGLIVNGAFAAMQSGGGTSHDVAAACVAVLRAAGIPARIVVGMQDVQTSSSGGATRTRLITWAEFYLPSSGWVPFDPMDIRSHGNSLPAPDKVWPSFGNWDDLNQRVPLSYAWSTPIPGSMSLPYPAVWSFSGSGGVSNANGNGLSRDNISVQMVNRGRVRE